MRSVRRQVAQEHVFILPALPPFPDIGAGMETGIVQNHDGQLVSGSVAGEFVNEGDHMGALDALLNQLEVQGAFFLAPSESADQVEPTVTTPPRRDAQAVHRSPRRPGIAHR